MPGNDKSVQKDRFVVLKNKQKNRLTVSIRKIAFSEIKEVDEMTKEKSSKIMYRKVGDYLIPNIILPPEQANITVGKWGMMHKDYIEHNKRGMFMLMVTKCTLWPYLADIDCQANEMYDLLIEQMKAAEGVTEQLKEQDHLEWVQRMSNIQEQAREIVCSELIYS